MCDDRFGNEDAAVACSQISGYSRQEASVIQHHSSAGGQGPIFLSNLNCVGTESNLLACSRQENQLEGVHNCDHSQDVVIKCAGTSKVI